MTPKINEPSRYASAAAARALRLAVRAEALADEIEALQGDIRAARDESVQRAGVPLRYRHRPDQVDEQPIAERPVPPGSTSGMGGRAVHWSRPDVGGFGSNQRFSAGSQRAPSALAASFSANGTSR